MPLATRPGRLGWVQAKTPPAPAGARIGVLGGSFNPAHAGHVLISTIAMKRLGLDWLWWLVTPGNPLKSNGDLPSLQLRIEAGRRLLPHPKVVVTAFEDRLGSPYTAATLDFLTHRHPAARFVWVMGADNLASFHRWQRWRSIAAQVPIAVVDRPGWRHRALASPAARAMSRSYVPEDRAGILADLGAPAWTLLTGPLSQLSSTALRKASQAVDVAQ